MGARGGAHVPQHQPRRDGGVAEEQALVQDAEQANLGAGSKRRGLSVAARPEHEDEVEVSEAGSSGPGHNDRSLSSNKGKPRAAGQAEPGEVAELGTSPLANDCFVLE